MTDTNTKNANPMTQIEPLDQKIVRKEHELNNLKRFQELEKAARPLVDFLKSNYNPHCKIIVEVDRVEVVCGEMSSPL